MKILRSFLVACVLFFVSNALAADELSICSNSFIETEIQKSLAKNDSCSGESFDVLLGDVFLKTYNTYDLHAKKIQTENVLSADGVAANALETYRSYQQCLQVVCDRVQSACASNESTVIATNIQNYSACVERANLYGSVQKINLETAVIHNAERKKRSFFRERMRLLEQKIQAWFVPIAIKLVNNIANFESKVTDLVVSPQ